MPPVEVRASEANVDRVCSVERSPSCLPLAVVATSCNDRKTLKVTGTGGPVAQKLFFARLLFWPAGVVSDPLASHASSIAWCSAIDANGSAQPASKGDPTPGGP